MTTAAAASTVRRGMLRLASGQVHYVWHPPPLLPSAAAPLPPPVVLFGGTAQTINSLMGHHGPLAKRGGGLFQYELRGQGTATTLSLDDCSLARHVEDLSAVLDAAADEGMVLGPTVDLVGFSFGARVALAAAAELPSQVRRLVVTGVPADRGATGRVILRAWLSALERDDLNGFLWQSMSDGHSAAFLRRHERKLAGWVSSAASQNRVEAILGLVRDSHVDDGPWHTVSLAQKAAVSLLPDDVLFIAGEQDRLAPPEQVAALAQVGGWRVETVPGCGHAVPVEQPRLWRQLVLEHLNLAQ